MAAISPSQLPPIAPAGPLARQAVDGLLPCQRDPQLWFSERPDELELAKAHCRPCPLRGPCLAGAAERREPYGVWGGEIFDHGTITARKRPRGRPPAAGPPPGSGQPVHPGRAG
jgi:WhiB family transcriptional regulator, redox-sensing transcriptional regulator